MKLPKPSRPPPQSKPSPSKPEQLSVREVSKLTKAGRQDGFHSLPKKDEESGLWNSPLLQQEANAYDEFCVYTWGELQQEHEQSHREISSLCQEIRQIEERLLAKRKEAPPPPDLAVRLRGEEKQSDALISRRRQNEYENANAKYFGELRRMESALDQTRSRLSEIHGMVQAAERTTAMTCERAAGSAMQRVTIYWQGALRTHPYFSEMPPTPEIALESDAQADYHAQNKHIREEAERILSRGHYTPSSGGPTANTTRRTEGRNVTQKKTTRK